MTFTKHSGPSTQFPNTILLLLLCLCAMLLPVGCSSGLSAARGTANVAANGSVHGGQQPVSLASIQLYAYDVTNGFVPLLAVPLVSGLDGSFTINEPFNCPTPTTPIVISAKGGNPGLTLGTNNMAITLYAAIGDCDTLTTSTFITINEVTTVAFAAQYAAITAATNATAVETAFSTIAMFANSTTGTSPGVGQTSTDSGGRIPTDEINTLANIIATCVNSDGSTATGTPCGKLFALIPGASDTFTALADLEASPSSYDTSSLFMLAPSRDPFQPSLSTAPTTWAVVVAPPPPASGLLNVSPNAGTTGDTVVITSNDPAMTATVCPFTPPFSISFGNVLASGSFTTTKITVTVPSGVPAGSVTGTIQTTQGSCTFPFFSQSVSAYAVSTSTVNFGTQANGTSSAPQQVTFTNNNGSGATVQVTAVSVTGPSEASFPITADNCTGVTVGFGGSCSVSVKFSPMALGSVNAPLTFYVNGSPINAGVQLSGTGN